MAANERLRAALLEHGETPESIAELVGVDRKTVERWIGGRTPYRRHRYQLSRHLETDETYLWPGSHSDAQLAGLSENEILTVHPHRWAVPSDTWMHFFDSAEDEIGILVISGYFIAENRGLVSMLKAKADSGVRVRVLVGDPGSSTVAERGADEEIGDALAGRIRNVLILLRPLLASPGAELRLHSTTLYNSIYRADDDLLVNTHIYGFGAPDAPVLHLRRLAGGSMVSTYLESFEKVWARARPLDGEA